MSPSPFRIFKFWGRRPWGGAFDTLGRNQRMVLGFQLRLSAFSASATFGRCCVLLEVSHNMTGV